jgi:hypothetical protein
MAKYIVHYESIVQEKLVKEIEADSLEEAEKLAEQFCAEGDTSEFELDVVMTVHPTIYSITKQGDKEVGRYRTEVVYHDLPNPKREGN